MNDLPVSGWFEDPKDPTQERWWNGSSWTDLVRDRRYPPPIVEPSRIVQPPQGTNTWAVVGFIMGLLGWVFNPFLVSSLLGVIFSSLGVARANSLSESTGERVLFPLAIVGLVLSIVAGLAVLLNVSLALNGFLP